MSREQERDKTLRRVWRMLKRYPNLREVDGWKFKAWASWFIDNTYVPKHRKADR